MVRGGLKPHQFHCGRVFLALLRIQRQSGRPLQFARQVGKLTKRNLAVMITNCRAGPAAAAVRKQGHVCPRLQIIDFAMSGEQSELDEMIAAAAGAQLAPCAVLVLLGDWIWHYLLRSLDRPESDPSWRLIRPPCHNQVRRKLPRPTARRHCPHALGVDFTRRILLGIKGNRLLLEIKASFYVSNDGLSLGILDAQ